MMFTLYLYIYVFSFNQKAIDLYQAAIAKENNQRRNSAPKSGDEQSLIYKKKRTSNTKSHYQAANPEKTIKILENNKWPLSSQL